ncbi:hypothetical protein M0812_08660 [Anaeramoeba flamelloides]|uniref:Uncharacterized protein n=1 Tax=Anaeramoeba flamelloides TaxID=1746091 RepID=A0AAV8A1P9_9EUKA|nr:hypothetical protein M0812_08660 [Anaeramoeba flamelloides]
MNTQQRKAERIMVSGYLRKKLSHGLQGTLTMDDFETKHLSAWSRLSKEEQGLLLKSLPMARSQRLELFRTQFSKYFIEKYSTDDPKKIVSVYFDSVLLLSLMVAYRQGSSGTRNCWGTFYRRKGLKNNPRTTDSSDSLRMSIPNGSDEKGSNVSKKKQQAGHIKKGNGKGCRNERSNKRKKNVLIKKNNKTQIQAKTKTKTNTLTLARTQRKAKTKRLNKQYNKENVLPYVNQFSNDFLRKWIHDTCNDDQTKKQSCSINNNARKRNYEDSNIVSKSSCQRQQEQNNHLCKNSNKIKIANNSRDFDVLNASYLSEESATNKTKIEDLNKFTQKPNNKSENINSNINFHNNNNIMKSNNRNIINYNNNNTNYGINNCNFHDNYDNQISQVIGEPYSTSSHNMSKFVDFPTQNDDPLFSDFVLNSAKNDYLLFDTNRTFNNNNIHSGNNDFNLDSIDNLDDVDKIMIQDQEEICDQTLLSNHNNNQSHFSNFLNSSQPKTSLDECADSFQSFSYILDIDLSNKEKNEVKVDPFQLNTYSEIIERDGDVSNCINNDHVDDIDIVDDIGLNTISLNTLELDFQSLQNDQIENLFF